MRQQVCFTCDDQLVTAIDELAKKMERSRSDTVNTVLWLAMQVIKAKNPQNFGQLLQVWRS